MKIVVIWSDVVAKERLVKAASELFAKHRVEFLLDEMLDLVVPQCDLVIYAVSLLHIKAHEAVELLAPLSNQPILLAVNSDEVSESDYMVWYTQFSLELGRHLESFDPEYALDPLAALL